MSKRPLQPEDLLAIKTIPEVQISPDGTCVAYVLSEIDTDADDYCTTLWLVSTKGGEPTQFTRGPKHDSSPRWSPDGTQIAFLSDRTGDQSQLYVMPVTGGEARQLTTLDHDAGPVTWSPDGKSILFAARVQKENPPTGENASAAWNNRARVITRAQYKADGQGYTFDSVSQLFVVFLESGQVVQLTDGVLENRAEAWSPDGKQIAFSRSRGGIADYGLYDIWLTLAPHTSAGGNADGTNARRVSENIGRATSPTFSPDGAWIACYGTDAQDKGLGDPMVRVWLIPVAGGAPRRLGVEFDRAALLVPPPAVTPGPMWARDSKSVSFIATDAGNTHIVRVNIADGTVKKIVAGERQITSAAISPNERRLAFSATDPSNPFDVFVCDADGANEKQLTHVNAAWLAQVDLPRTARRIFKNPNGGTLDGWVTYPVNSNKPAPLIVEVHGGPHSFAGNIFPLGYFYGYVLAARGWAMLALNPTGSGSYSKDFAFAIHGRWGEYDLPEQLAAIDALVAEEIVDGNRLAVSGYSYGGFMTSWVITHSDRFKAAIVGAPVVNQESMHGTSDIGMWFAQVQMKTDIFSGREILRRLSPINYVDRVTTPTLIMHGEADDRCPIGQGEELFMGLVAAGKAPVQFVRYPGESHLFRGRGKPSHRVDLTRRVIEWVEKYCH